MPIPQTDTGPFLSALGWAGSVGQIPLQLLRGRPGAAGRKLVDVLGDIPDAVLPGDWIPHVGDEDPNVRPSEMVGIDPNAHPGIAKAVDIVGGAATNPLSYVGLRGGTLKAGLPLTEGTAIPGATGLIQRGKDLVGRGIAKLPEGVRNTATQTGAAVRRVANWMDQPDDLAAIGDAAKGRGSQQAEIASERVRQIYEGATPDERSAVGDIVHRINRAGGSDRNQWSVIDDTQAYLNALPPTVNRDRVTKLVSERAALMDSLAQDPTHGLVDAARAAGETGQGYGMRRFSGSYFDDLPAPDFLPKGASSPSALKARSIGSPDEMLGFMRDNKNVDLDFDPLSFDMRRAAQSGRIAEKAKLGEQLIPKRVEKLQADLNAANDPTRIADLDAKIAVETNPKTLERLQAQRDLGKGIQSEINGISSAVGHGPGGGFRLNNPDHVSAVRKAIDDLAASGETDSAYRLKNMFDGVPGRGEDAFSQVLHKGNKIFKAAATFGVALPRIAFNVGNRASGLWQVLSNDVARGSIGPATRRAVGDLFGAVDDGLMRLFKDKGRWAKDELTKSLDSIDRAQVASQGDMRKFRELLSAEPNGQTLQEALDAGVLNGFVDSEQLISRMAKTPAAQRVQDFMEWPADISAGIEQRMRLGTFMDLRKRGIEAPAASKTIQDTYLNYDSPGVGNRRLRDAVPFAAFMTQNLKQQAGLVARHPVVASAAAPLFTDDENNPRYPWMDRQAAVPVGLDEKGDSQFITGFRSPLEGLAGVPGSNPSDIWSDTVGNFQPLLKTALSYAANRDPFTGRDFGTYDKILGHSAGEAGRAYNIAKGSGLFQPLSGPLDQVTNLLDDRKSAGQRAIQATTGVRFTSVDADQAKRQRIEQYLEQNPEASQYTGYYNSGEDPGLSDLLKQLTDSKKRLSDKRKAAAAVL